MKSYKNQTILLRFFFVILFLMGLFFVFIAGGFLLSSRDSETGKNQFSDCVNPFSDCIAACATEYKAQFNPMRMVCAFKCSLSNASCNTKKLSPSAVKPNKEKE